MAQTKKTSLIVRVALFLLISLALGLSLIWRDRIDGMLGLNQAEETSAGGETETVTGGDGGDLVVHFIDVGQGDACVVELPDGRSMLIDAGPRDSSDALLTYLDEHFTFDKFDFAILTHSDEDHCGEFPDVLEQYGVGTFYRPNEKSTRESFADPDAAKIVGTGEKNTIVYRDTIQAAHAVSDEVLVTHAPLLDASGDDLITPEGIAKNEEGYYEITFFGPYTHSYTDHNNYSPIIIIEYQGKRIAVSGDAEKEAEEDFVKHAGDKDIKKFERFTDDFTADVVKLGHHGSRTSSSEDYLNTLTTPQSTKDVLAVISCGIDNDYGHPHAETLSRLTELGFSSDNVLRTDLKSDIVVSVRFDEPKQGYLLFYDGTAYSGPARNTDGGSFRLSWLMIAIGLWALFAVLLLILPAVVKPGKSGTSSRKTAKKSSGKKNW